MFCCTIDKKETLVTKLILTREILRQKFKENVHVGQYTNGKKWPNTNYVAQFL